MSKRMEILNIICAVLRLCNKVAAISDDATARAIWPGVRICTKIILVRKVFPIPLGTQKQNFTHSIVNPVTKYSETVDLRS